MNESSKKMTIDDLARMIKNDVVDKMATKEDLERFATKDDLKKLEDKLDYHVKGLNNRLDEHAFNKVGYDKFDPLVKRVEVLEKKN